MSFKFNFSVEDSAGTDFEPAKPHKQPEQSIAKNDATIMPPKFHNLQSLKSEWRNADTVLYTVESIDINETKKMYFIQPHMSHCNSASKEHIKQSKNTQDNSEDIVPLETDLVPGIYEGGLKVWECSVDLVNFLMSCDDGMSMQGRVLELGCGIGLPGIFAADLGAESVTFQDFNDFVITNATAPSILLNQFLKGSPNTAVIEVTTDLNVNDLLFDDKTDLDEKKFTFISGDWTGIESLLTKKFDIILSAETIYCIDYYERLHAILQHALCESGSIYIAAKSFYFGVGGGVHLWEEFVKSKGIFAINAVQNVDAPLKRHVLKMKFKK